jgi:hypothetical protein
MKVGGSSQIHHVLANDERSTVDVSTIKDDGDSVSTKKSLTRRCWLYKW